MATQLLIKYKSGALVTQLAKNLSRAYSGLQLRETVAWARLNILKVIIFNMTDELDNDYHYDYLINLVGLVIMIGFDCFAN